MCNRAGFTLIEILIALGIIALLAATAIPALRRFQSGYQRDQFISQFSSLVQFTWQNALVTQRVHRVVFDFQKNSIRAEKETKEKDREGKPIFEPVKGTYRESVMRMQPSIQLTSINIAGSDELKRFGGAQSKPTVWFYLVPDGMSQEVTIQAVDKKDTIGRRPRTFTLTLNPFTLQLKVKYA